jgi:hypothetical protein
MQHFIIYYSDDQIKEDKMGGAFVHIRMGERINACSVGIATGYRMDGWVSIPSGSKSFFSSQ